jgi:hypothetical protein
MFRSLRVSISAPDRPYCPGLAERMVFLRDELGHRDAQGTGEEAPRQQTQTQKDKKKEARGTAGLSQDEGGSDSTGTVLRLSD